MIKKLHINVSLEVDMLIWIGNPRGVFNVENAYMMKSCRRIDEKGSPGQGSNSTPLNESLWKNLCKLKILGKAKMFAWKV